MRCSLLTPCQYHFETDLRKRRWSLFGRRVPTRASQLVLNRTLIRTRTLNRTTQRHCLKVILVTHGYTGWFVSFLQCISSGFWACSSKQSLTWFEKINSHLQFLLVANWICAFVVSNFSSSLIRFQAFHAMISSTATLMSELFRTSVFPSSLFE